MSTLAGRWPLPARTVYLWWEGTWSLLHSVAFALSMLLYARLRPRELTTDRVGPGSSAAAVD